MGILTRKEQLVIELLFKAACACNVLDGDWDPEHRLLVPRLTTTNRKLHKTKVRTLLYYGFQVGVGFWASYCGWRLHKVVFTDDVAGEFGILLQLLYLYLFVCSVTCVISYWPLAWFKDELLELFNQLLIFSRKNDFGEQADQMDRLHRERRLLMIEFLYCLAGISWVPMIYLAETHFVWLMSNNVLLSCVIGLGFAGIAIQAVITYGFAKLYVFMLCTVTGSVFLICSGEDSKSVDLYRCLCILCGSFNRSYSRGFLLGIKYGLATVGIMCIVLAVRLRHVTEAEEGGTFFAAVFLLIALHAFLALMVCANLLSAIWYKSVEFIENFCGNTALTWRDDDIMGNMQKILVGRSLQPLRIQIGGLYHMEKQAKLTLADFIVSGSASLVVMFRQ